MRLRCLSRLLCAALLLGCTASCNETIVLAEIPLTDAGTPVPLTRCIGPSDCPIGLFCSKDSCGAAAGTCKLPPVTCDQAGPPVCGCDGITYFNDCLRQANGVAAAQSNECPFGTSLCGGPNNVACPTGATCALLGGFPHGPCSHDIPGSCWVIPATCPPSSGTDRWDSCSDQGAQCVDTCTAIQSGGVYRRAGQCP